MARKKKENNIHLVAEAAGVSVATVSRVVNNRTDVSEAVRKKVTDVIARFNFSPTKSQERPLNIGVVAVLAADRVNSYISQILDGVAEYTAGENIDLTVILYRIRPDAKSLMQQIRERRCDAVVIFPPAAVASQLAELRDAEIPAILLNGSDFSGPRMGRIGNDSGNGARIATEYLISCGHRRIGFLCNALTDRDHRDRLDAYHDAMRRAGIEVNPAWVIAHTPTEETAEAGYLQCRRLLTEAPDVTAVFCTNDEMAMGAIKCCADLGRSVPEDISIIGFGDMPSVKYLRPALTTIRQPLAEGGSLAVRSLADFLKGRISELPDQILPNELVIRDSVLSIQ